MADAFAYGFDLLRQVALYFVQPLTDGLQVWHLYALALILALGVGLITSWYHRNG